MEQFEISASKRSDAGKGASRRLRRAGVVPAIVYGAGDEPEPIQLDQNDVLRHIEHEAFYSHILTLTVDNVAQKVVLKDMQRHAHKPIVMHMDFLRIDEAHELNMRIPLHFLNEDTCIGVKQQGGVVSHLMSDIEITCLPKDLPEYLEIDLADLEVGSTFHIGEIEPPEGVQLTALMHGGDPQLPVVAVQTARIEVEEEPEQLEAGEAPEASAEDAGESED
ncbi:MAG: 50S ribosomal protein L25/general stress protein Ctc [Pseudomonadota bacterium]